MKTFSLDDSNCWRIERADRAAFAVDGETYFAAVREAILKARRCVFLVGWDIHSRVELLRKGPDDGAPTRLGELLDHCAKRHRNLRIYVLNWDFAMIYSLEREFFPRYRLQWKSHRRVEFCLDGNHPVGASQHQKLVVVDDSLAFSGGFDLAQWRWDTREHRSDDPHRKDPLGRSYRSFHDIQMVVSGDAARTLGELARSRWNGAQGCEPVSAPVADLDDRWPEGLDVALTDVDIAFSLTRPAYNGQPELRQVEQLFLDCIANAQRFIYFENQYFTSHRIGDAIAESLAQPRGPQIIIVLPKESRGWLEQHTMDVLRSRLLRRLREADGHDRLRVYSPRLADGSDLLVHAKIAVVDDDFVRIGSANLSNRSMGLDSECDLSLQACGIEAVSTAIAGFRRELLAEHLDVDKGEVIDAEQKHDSLIAAVESLLGGERTLEQVSHELPQRLDERVPDAAVIDPEAPIEPEEFLRYVIGDREWSARRYAKPALLIMLLVALAALWRLTPLSEYLSVENAAAAATWIESSPYSLVLVLLAFVLGSLAAIPLTLMIIATLTAFGPWQGMLYSLLAAEVAALVTYAVGRGFGTGALASFADSRLNRIKRRLSRPGLLGIIALRMVPVAPFTVINVAAGAARLNVRDYALGTLFGMLPGVAAIAFLADRVAAVIEVPEPATLLALAAAFCVLLVMLAALRRWLIGRSARS